MQRFQGVLQEAEQWWRFNRTDLLSCDYEAQIADPYSPVSANLITQVIGNKREEMNPNFARSVHLKDGWDLMITRWLMHHHLRESSNGTMLPMSSNYQQKKPCNIIKLSLKHTNLTLQAQLLLNTFRLKFICVCRWYHHFRHVTSWSVTWWQHQDVELVFMRYLVKHAFATFR